MGLVFDNIAVASGKARCKVCGEIIYKGELCINVWGYGYQSGFCHTSCPNQQPQEHCTGARLPIPHKHIMKDIGSDGKQTSYQCDCGYALTKKVRP